MRADPRIEIGSAGPATERRFNCYYAEFLPVTPEKLRPHDHAGVEFIDVIDGSLILQMNGEEHGVEAGDAVYFDATTPHACRRSGGGRCSAVVVTASGAASCESPCPSAKC